MNVNGKGQMGAVIIAVAILLVGGIVAFGLFSKDEVLTQTATGTGGVGAGGQCADSTGVLTVSPRSQSAYGVAYSSPTITCGVNGGSVTTAVTSGTTTFPINSQLSCLVSKGDYIDNKFDFNMDCGGVNLDAPLWYSTSDNPSLTWYNDDDNAMTDDVTGGATNQTDLSAGETFTLNLKIQGTSGESSGNGVLVIEFPASSSANITTVTLGGNQPIATPSFHASQNAGSKVVAFDVPAVTEGNVVEMPLQVQLTASRDLAGGVLSDWYSKQYFIDDDSTLKEGVQDSDGTVKYENTLDRDFFID